jgi:NAD(P)-dependent dehydrogenase (short-subunit alcohol dehydrogenase family)
MANTVLITGASSGFGKATAMAFQQKGWQVIATMRSPDKEEELTKLKNILVERLDVQDPTSIKEALEAGIKKFGNINTLVNNAGYGTIGVFESATPDQIKNQFEVNVFGLMQVTQAVLPYLRKNGYGTIINISSFGGITAMPFGSIYNSSKFAVEGLSEALSFELSALNIAVKLIEPGSSATNFRNGAQLIKNEIPAYAPLFAQLFARFAKAAESQRKATPEEVAATIYQAATDGKTQLRYVVGDDAQFFIDLKTKTPEPEFIRSMLDYFVH